MSVPVKPRRLCATMAPAQATPLGGPRGLGPDARGLKPKMAPDRTGEAGHDPIA